MLAAARANSNLGSARSLVIQDTLAGKPALGLTDGAAMLYAWSSPLVGNLRLTVCFAYTGTLTLLDNEAYHLADQRGSVGGCPGASGLIS